MIDMIWMGNFQVILIWNIYFRLEDNHNLTMFSNPTIEFLSKTILFLWILSIRLSNTLKAIKIVVQKMI